MLAAALHVVVILAVKVPEPRLRNPLPAIDVVLQPGFTPAPSRPEEANVEPVNNADGPVAAPAKATPENATPEEATPDELPNPSTEVVADASPDPASVPRENELAGATTRDLVNAIAAQAQRLDTESVQGSDQGEPLRIRRLAGPPSGDPELAYYLGSWRRKVERVGNINYPSEARARGLSGTLRLLVVIDPDGELKDVQVLASSGHPLLDDGAVRIVHLAAPFSPFTPNMRAAIDVLEIERTWRFQKDRLTPVP